MPGENGVVEAYGLLVVGGVPVVFRLLGDRVITGGNQAGLHDQHGPLAESLALPQGRQRPELIDYPVRVDLDTPNSGASCRIVLTSLPNCRGLSPVNGAIQDGSDAVIAPDTARSPQLPTIRGGLSWLAPFDCLSSSGL